ncbi:MAG: zinc finger domain-containing protein [Candidatus Hodarchaeales archaeon]|jgi:predicted RNA-binding Zn-ribbon protein involved in translation (DUF1610 family)
MIQMSHCSCCQTQIVPEDVGTVRFDCPECNQFLIIRCGRCRNLGNQFKCHNCGFSGP